MVVWSSTSHEAKGWWHRTRVLHHESKSWAWLSVVIKWMDDHYMLGFAPIPGCLWSQIKCKILHKYCIFQVPYTFGPYAKWLNTDGTSYGSLWLPHHLTLGWLVNSVSSKSVQLHSWQSLVSSQLWHRTPLHHALQVQSMKGRSWTMIK